jgi:hypothetical protein
MIPSLKSVVMLLAATVLFPFTAHAEHQALHDPDARVRIIVESVHINEDGDTFSPGDLTFWALLYRCTGLTLDGVCDGQVNAIGELIHKFTADDGVRVRLNSQLIARMFDGSITAEGYGSEETGLSVYSGESFHLMFLVNDSDDGRLDPLGDANFYFDEENGWGNGPHDLPSIDRGRGPNGNFVVQLQIDRMPLANLVAQSIEVVDKPGSTDRVVCSTLVNAGMGDADPFDITVRIDGGTPPGGKQRINGLARGTQVLSCFETDRMPHERPHFVSLSLDEAREVPEMDETSNQRINENFPAVASPEGSGSPSSSQPQADLIVSAIRVNGEPSSANDCKEGKNDVTLIIKNQGSAMAAGSVARLTVGNDDDDAEERTVESLNPGADKDVRFDDVRLKKGDQTLTAIADARKAVAESKEDNNELKATVKCEEDD